MLEKRDINMPNPFDKLKANSQSPAPPQDINKGASSALKNILNSAKNSLKDKKLNSEAPQPLSSSLEKSASVNLTAGDKETASKRPLVQDESPETPAVISADEFIFESQPDKFSDEEVQDLREALDIVVNNIEHKDLVGDAMRNVMQMIAANPNLKDLMMPQDIGIMTRALRINYGVLIEKKTERSTKTSQAKKDVKEVADMMENMGIKF